MHMTIRSYRERFLSDNYIIHQTVLIRGEKNENRTWPPETSYISFQDVVGDIMR